MAQDNEPLPGLSDLTARDSITRENALRSPLLLLPSELRNEIYALACGTLTSRRNTNRSPYTRFIPQHDRSGASLRLVSRQVYAEASPYFKRHFCLNLVDEEHPRDCASYMGQALCAQFVIINFGKAAYDLVTHNVDTKLDRPYWNSQYWIENRKWADSVNVRNVFPNVRCVILPKSVIFIERRRVKKGRDMRWIFDSADLEVLFQ